MMLHEEMTDRVLGAAVEVHRVLGPGFLEAVYREALGHELALRRIPFEPEVKIPVQYKGFPIGTYKADFVVDQNVILEIKGASALAPAHVAQALHYLAATGYRLALLLSFGASKLQIKRLIR